MLKQRRKSFTLADSISNILSVAPSSVDPEDDADDSKAKVTEGAIEDEDDEILLSKFRKDNIDFLEDVDKRYASKKISRRDLKDSDEDWETDEELEDRSDVDSENDDYSSDAGDSDKEQNSSDESENDDDNVESSGDDENNSDASSQDNFKAMNDNDVNNQVKKGNCVRNQVIIWENLLETRIQLQKCLVTANKMPQKNVFREIKMQTPGKFDSKVDETMKNLSNVLNKLVELQSLLLNQFPETKKLLAAQANSDENHEKNEEIPSEIDEEIPSETDEEIPSETDDENDQEMEGTEIIPCKKRKLSDYEREIRNNHDIYRSYRNSVIQKWNDKTRLAVAKNNTSAHTVLNQINHILNDKQKLIKRTQVKRSNYEILGKTNSCDTEEPIETNETDVEIFDDDDFYHQLLRELIEVKSADVTDPVQLGRQWIQLQDMRSKMKRNIDTRATKGRKVRYNVHTKLVNFMAPVDNNLLSEKARTDYYSSLFGKNKSVSVSTK